MSFDIYDMPSTGKKLVVTDGAAYVFDMSAMDKLMRDAMPMITEPPVPDPFKIRMRCFTDFGPVMRQPGFLITSVCDGGPSKPDPDDGWEFAYLFPLGVRAYKRSKR